VPGCLLFQILQTSNEGGNVLNQSGLVSGPLRVVEEHPAMIAGWAPEPRPTAGIVLILEAVAVRTDLADGFFAFSGQSHSGQFGGGHHLKPRLLNREVSRKVGSAIWDVLVLRPSGGGVAPVALYNRSDPTWQRAKGLLLHWEQTSKWA
jgi:hypothetical protein